MHTAMGRRQLSRSPTLMPERPEPASTNRLRRAKRAAPANDFANAFPKWISFRTGGLITGIVGILMQPWRLLADPSGYIFTWLVGYSGGLGSIAGVLIVDYWLVRQKRLALGDLVAEMAERERA